MGRVLLVGVPTKDRHHIEKYFKAVGVVCESQPTMEKALERIPDDPPTLVIAEKSDSPDELTTLNHVLKTNAPATPYLVLMRSVNLPDALNSMTKGAFDCLARPLNRKQVLAAAKKATQSSGRTLFATRVREEEKPWGLVLGILLFIGGFAGWFRTEWNGGPVSTINLASATLAGIEWNNRSLWVSNWYDSTITHYELSRSFIRKNRQLVASEIFKMVDSQPVLVTNTDDALVTVGFDLKIRSHQRFVGLPTLQTVDTPGSNPTGLAWDGSNVWSVDGQTGYLYRHGPDLQVLDRIKCILPNPSGLSFDGKSFWVIGGAPLSLARLEKREGGYVWSGPYNAEAILPAGIEPSGLAVAYDRLWLVSGGTPWMVSKKLKDITSELSRWPHANKKKESKEKKEKTAETLKKGKT